MALKQAVKQVKTTKAERLEYNKGKGIGKKLGFKMGKKKGILYGLLAALTIGVIGGSAGFFIYTGIDYAQNKDKSPDKQIKVTNLGKCKIPQETTIPSASILMSCLIHVNPKINANDFEIKDIKVNGVNGTAKVVSSHWWVGGSIKITYIVDNT